MRKDTPTTTPVEICHRNWCRVFEPLFDDHELVQQSLVDLRPNNIIPKLNASLKNLEAPLEERENPFVEPRPEERKGIYLADDDYGLLVTDMLPGMFHLQVLFWIYFAPMLIFIKVSSARSENSSRNGFANLLPRPKIPSVVGSAHAWPV